MTSGAVSPDGSIRIGIMCNGTTFPAWQAAAIRSLLEIPQVEISLLIVRGASDPRRRSAVLSDRRHLLWLLYNKGYVERRSRASKPVDMSADLAGAAEIRCRTEPVGRYGEKFTDSDVATIRSNGLDLILRFGFGILKGEVLESARYGVWSFHHGDERRFRGQPPGFWELYEGEPVVGAILQRITERLDGGTVLHRGSFRVTRHSYRRTRDDLFLGASHFASVAVRRLLSGESEFASAPPSTTEAPLRRSPRNLTTLRFILRMGAAFVAAQWRGLTRSPKWSVGTAAAPVAKFLDEVTPTIAWVPEDRASRYFADPFPDPTGATDQILVEDFDHSTGRGVISALGMNGDRKARPVLDTGVHASYPYLFENDGVIYCTPETYQAGEVRLYKATSFPEEWELAGTLLDGIAALDPTVFTHEGRWWMFLTIEGPHANTHLHAFHAPALDGPWLPHLLNPIKADVTSARPAGVPFLHGGSLYRPAQDCSSSYGGALAINRIEELTPERFSETTVKRINPPSEGRYRDGIHTLSGRGSTTVIDGRRDTFIYPAFRREWSGRWRRLTRRS